MRFSNLISIVLHPVFIPVFMFFLITQFVPDLINSIRASINYVYFILILFTILLPVLTILTLIRFNLISSLQVNKVEERPLAIIVSLNFFLIGYYFLLSSFQDSPVLKYIFLAGVLTLLAALIISKKWKISLHLLGAGNITGVFVFLQIQYTNLLFLVFTCFILSGILGYSRLKEKAHNNNQVYSGFLIGFFLQYSLLYFYF